MNLKIALTLTLLVVVPSFIIKTPNTKNAISSKSKEAFNDSLLRAHLKKVLEDSLKILHRQTRNDTIFGNEIADSLAARTTRYRGGSHYCYRVGKKPILDIMNVQLTGMSAYMAADQHANAIDSATGWPYYIEMTDPKNPVFKDNEVVLSIEGLNRLYMEQPWNNDVKNALKKELQENLPKGVAMVWDRLKQGKGNTWVYNGHFAITLGNGKERSWKTMDIAVFPTKLRLFIPNHTSYEYTPDSYEYVTRLY